MNQLSPETRDRWSDQVVALLPAIEQIAWQVGKRLPATISHEDLVQAGAAAAWEAMPRWDPARGVKLQTWILPRVRGGMIDFLRETGYLMHGGRRSGRVEKRQHLEARDPDSGKLLFDAPDAAAAEAERLRDAGENFAALLKGLNQTERLIVVLYFVDGLKMREIGEQLDLSESRVSQLMSSLLTRLAPIAARQYGVALRLNLKQRRLERREKLVHRPSRRRAGARQTPRRAA